EYIPKEAYFSTATVRHHRRPDHQSIARNQTPPSTGKSTSVLHRLQHHGTPPAHHKSTRSTRTKPPPTGNKELTSNSEINSTDQSQSLAASLEAELTNTPDEYLSKCCIYRVPGLLRRGNEEAYTPKMVSIGPYHHKDERLLPMESHKLKFLKFFLTRYNHTNILNLCLETIKSLETEIRHSYADPIALSSDDFTRMILIDSAFIIELSKRHDEKRYLEARRGSYLYGQVWIDELLRDLLLLENQLPFFILNKIHYIAENSSRDDPNAYFQTEISRLVLRFFNENKVSSGADRTVADGEYWHLLDLVRGNYVPSNSGPTKPIVLNIQKGMYSISPTATILHESGVKFRVSKDDFSELYLLIEFDEKSGILTIPKLRAWDTSQSLFKNMIAFEQCTYSFRSNTYITNYHHFLDCLINTPQDVQLLADAGIIHNWLGNDVLCDAFNGISKNTRCMWSSYQYEDVCERLNEHCSRNWNRHKAALKNKYFKHPWAAASVVYAIVLLILTLVQVSTGILAVPGVLPK
ncbi:hypothetical protein V2J09_013742, partial [Rumex salicifolius]